MGERVGIDGHAERRARRRGTWGVIDSSGGVVAMVPCTPSGADRVPVGEADGVFDIAAPTVQRWTRGGEVAAERIAPREGPALRVRRSAVEDAVPSVERVVHTTPTTAGGLAVWCSLAVLAGQLAAATADQARARAALEREHRRLVLENRRLVAVAEDAVAVIATQADEHARAGQRARWLVYGLSLVVAGLGALVLTIGLLAAVGQRGA